jgi:Glycosyltransferases involved in cell wall biogenesis
LLFPHWITVLIVSLALYGLWHFCRDLWGLWPGHTPARQLNISLLIVVRNAAATIENHLRHLLHETAFNPVWREIVVVDHGSDDLTPAILDRLAASSLLLKVVHLSPLARPVGEAMPFCEGDVVEVLDMVNRLESADWDAAIRLLVNR